MKHATHFINELASQSYIPYYNKRAMPMLEEAILHEIQRNNGAVWYGDFVEPIVSYLVDQFNNGVFLPNSGSRKYMKDVPEEEFNNDLHARMKDIAAAQLKQLSAKQPESFFIQNGYKLLRKKFGMGENDRVEFVYPQVIFEQLPDLLDKIEFFGGKRIGEFWGDKKHYGNIREIDDLKSKVARAQEDYFDNERTRKRLVNKILPKYLKTVGNTRIAYTNFDSALRMISPYFSFNARGGRNMIVPLKI